MVLVFAVSRKPTQTVSQVMKSKHGNEFFDLIHTHTHIQRERENRIQCNRAYTGIRETRSKSTNEQNVK